MMDDGLREWWRAAMESGRMKYFNNVQVPWYYSAGRWVLYITLH